MGCSGLDTHCYIGSKRAYCPFASDVETWTVNTSLTECSRQQRLPKLGFLGTHSAKTVCPPKFMYKRHIIEMSTSPWNNSHHPTLCHLSCTTITNTPSKLSPFSCFCGLENPCTEMRKFFITVHMRTPIHVFCFKNGQNRCRISVWKATLVAWQNKHILAPLGGSQGDFPQFLCECAPWPFTYIPGFFQIRSGFGKL